MEIAALENTLDAARESNRQDLAGLIVDAGLILGHEPGVVGRIAVGLLLLPCQNGT